MNAETYVFGNKNVPDWFNKEATSGRVKINYDDDGQIVNAKIVSGMKEYIANPGDTIMYTKSGLVVISKEKANKYMTPVKAVTKKAEEVKEEKEEEEEIDG